MKIIALQISKSVAGLSHENTTLVYDFSFIINPSFLFFTNYAENRRY